METQAWKTNMDRHRKAYVEQLNVDVGLGIDDIMITHERTM